MPTISDRDLADIDAWWRAANYLTVGQIYLLDNALLSFRRSRRPPRDLEGNLRRCGEALDRHSRYVREHFEDLPEIRDWPWGS